MQNEIKKIVTDLQVQLYKMDPALHAIGNAIITGQHALLWGPPGHAKTMVVESFLKRLLTPEKYYEEVWIGAGSQDMDTAPLVGFLNVPDFQNKGQYNYEVGQTIWMAREYAFLDETLDLPASALEAMKMHLNSKNYCVNGVCYPRKLKSFFGATNVNPYAWVDEDPDRRDSRLAVLGRFVHCVEVKWEEYNEGTWVEYLRHINKLDFFIAKLPELLPNMSITPRLLSQMADAYSVLGLDGLRTIQGMDQHLDNWALMNKTHQQMAFYQALGQLEEYEKVHGLGAKIHIERLLVGYRNIEGIPDDEYTQLIAEKAVMLQDRLNEILLEESRRPKLNVL